MPAGDAQQRAVRRLRALAVLRRRSAPIATSTAMCATAAIDEARFVARLRRARSPHTAARDARPHRVSDLLRRRHAVADAAARRSPRSSTPSRKHWAVAPDVESRSKPIRPASRRRASAATAPPASIASRSACRRSTIASLKELGRLHTAQEALDAVAIARVDLRALLVRPDLCAAAARRPSLARRTRRARSPKPAEHLSLYQLTIEPETPFFRAARGRQARHPGRRCWRAISTTLTQEICASAGLAGLRDFQPRAAGRGVPA